MDQFDEGEEDSELEDLTLLLEQLTKLEDFVPFLERIYS